MKNFSAKNAEFETVTINNEAAISAANIGTAPNQIPLNKDLGSLAYQDAVNLDDVSADMLELRAIAAEISDSAVDVFVYDTSRDSDGGAWRKRTQHTSWYNEELNTATRGARREFPAVAVIVAESNKVTIYDGDDPDLGMWMVFNASGENFAYGNLSSLSMVNSRFAITTKDSDSGNWMRGLKTLDFISEIGFSYDSPTNTSTDPNQVHKKGYYRGLVIDRNLGKGFDATIIDIVNHRVNDVAMTVLPNAPIDENTGLPVPTIAVATNGGVSVIKDDGTVVDIIRGTGSSLVNSISFDDHNKLIINNSGTGACYYNIDIPGADLVQTEFGGYTLFSGSIPASNDDLISGSKVLKNYVGHANSGLNILEKGLTDQGDGMIAYTTSKYNTGWMPGDIKLATLSDTTVETIGATTELITNGDFSNGDDGSWIVGDESTATFTNNQLTISGTKVGGPFVYQTTNLIAGQTYTFELDIDSMTTTTAAAYFGPSSNGIIATSAGKYSYTFVYDTSMGTLFYLLCNDLSGNNGNAVFNSVSLRPAVDDRSVNNNGLQIVGEINKTPVAPGADLVAYSGFSANNYLVQPYNADLDFGTGDFCVMGWHYNDHLCGIQKASDAEKNLGAGTFNTNNFVIFSGNNGRVDIVIDGVRQDKYSVLNNNTWELISVVRKDGIVYLYKNDLLIQTFENLNGDVNITNGDLYLGGYWYDGVYTASLNTNSALLRISATAPTADQISKIYRDEKALFTDGAQATLHGTSDAVTALAYDQKTQLLHVGTASGRSDFSGLRRINNTTTAITTSISAHNNLIAEQ